MITAFSCKGEELMKNISNEESLPKDFLNLNQLRIFQKEIWEMYEYIDHIVEKLTPNSSVKSFENFDKIFNIQTRDAEFDDFRDLYFSLQDTYNRFSGLINFLSE